MLSNLLCFFSPREFVDKGNGLNVVSFFGDGGRTPLNELLKSGTFYALNV